MQKAHLIPACLAACLTLTVSLGSTSLLAQEAGVIGEDRTETTGPTGMPGTSGQGGSADPTGEDLNPSHVTGIPAERFVNEATAKSHALIEMSQAALEQGSSDVQQFARRVIDEQREMIQQLRTLAEADDLQVSDDANLVDQGRTLVMQLRNGESFDQAYANNAASIARELVDMFESAAASDLGVLSEYAERTLPQVQTQRDSVAQMANAADD
ncbi:DUF4142 domain-containing protein [Halopseudomonas pelagia]|uniref:DUF4142 domain-containing protein n=1 Tax=Halopseudomonas pelagia TaxID=553151 RepID=UPI0003A4BB23|nr:DUF4142 domain-containing protein [Halopseudomonas pelagia]